MYFILAGVYNKIVVCSFPRQEYTRKTISLSFLNTVEIKFFGTQAIINCIDRKM